MHKLRDYQSQAVSKMLWARDRDGGSLVVLAQGGGKTHIIAEFARKIAEPVLILSPSKELLEQTHEKLCAVVDETEVGLYSASVGMKEVKKFTIATVQSAYKKPEDFSHFEIVLIDECDLVSPKNEESMYAKLLSHMSNPKIYGLTGTPYRLGTKYKRWGTQKWMVESQTVTQMINRHWGGIWKNVITCINTKDLLERGFLCPIEYHDMSLIDHKDIPVNKSKSDFDLQEFDKVFNDYNKLVQTISNLPHKSVIVYCSSVEQAESLNRLTPGSLVITAQTKKKDRENAVKSLRLNGGVIYNVGVLTVGFDYPQLEAIVLLRPTRSLRLHSQIIGRVSRTAEGKDLGHVYDFVSNVKQMGKIEDIIVGKDGENKWNVFNPSFPHGAHNEVIHTYRRKAQSIQNQQADDLWQQLNS